MEQSAKLIKIINDMMDNGAGRDNIVKYFVLRDILKKTQKQTTIQELEKVIENKRQVFDCLEECEVEKQYEDNGGALVKFFLNNFDDFNKCFDEYSNYSVEDCIPYGSFDLKRCIWMLARDIYEDTMDNMFEEIKKRFLFYKEE